MGCGASTQAAQSNPSAVPTTESKEDSPRQVQPVVPPLKIQNISKAGWSKEGEDTARESIGSRTPRRGGTQQQERRNSIEMSGRSFVRPATPELEGGTPDDVLEELLNGNLRFITGETQHPHQDFRRLQQIAPKQKPIAAILACADSRVPPEIVFDQGFGDIFVCRIAGNIATAEEIASLEYAVLDLGVKLIMVVGHTSCGAVKAALSGKAFPGFIDTLVDHLDVAVTRAQSRNATSYEELVGMHAALRKQGADGHPDPKLIELVIQENVKYQIDRCKRSTIILEAMMKKKLKVVGSVYNLETGEVEML